MESNLDKAVAAIDILHDESRLPVERYIDSMKALTGLNLSSLTSKARETIEAHGVRCNAILSEYGIESFDDYGTQISDADARELITHALEMAEATQKSEIETILARFRDHRSIFPATEIETARRHRSLFTPILLQELRDHIQVQSEQSEEDKQRNERSSIPFFAFLLLFEWDVAEAVPLVMESLRLPGDAPFQLYGDLVHEWVAPFLAHFLADDIEQIVALIRNRNANVFVRWSASKSLAYLVRDQKLSAATARKQLVELLYECRVIGEEGRPAPEHPFEVCTGIIEALDYIGGGSTKIVPDTSEVWDFVDEFILDRSSFYEEGSEDPDIEAPDIESKLPRQRHPTHLDDCLERIRHWGCFQRYPASSKPPQEKSPMVPVASPVLPRAATKRVGRNELCPCGSGKKYKKCCLQN